MSRTSVSLTLGLTGLLVALLCPPAAADQQTSPQVSPSGPLVLAPIASSIVFSPDVKVTTVDGKTAVLTGAYAGKLIEKKVLVGAGAYFLTDPRDTVHMFYAGLVVGGRLIGTEQFNLSARSLFGLGQATLYQTIEGGPEELFHRRDRSAGRPLRFGDTDDFWVADPEIHMEYLITDLISLDLGAGYRITSARRRLNEPFRGPTGSIGIRFSFE